MAFGKTSQYYSPYDYEEAVAAYLRTQGYQHVETTQMSGDFGADVVGVTPEGRRVCVQCKKYSSPVGVKAVQEVYSAKAYYGCTEAYVFATSGFTPQAEELALRTGVKLFVYEPGSVPHRYRKKGRLGCLWWLLVPVILIAALTVTVTRDETKIREERAQQLIESETVDGVYYQIQEDHVVVTGLADFNRSSIVIPAEVKGLPVTEIVKSAFSKEKITTVQLPASITTIGRGAFFDCSELRSINIPEGIVEIPDICFCSCEKLQSIKLPASVSSVGTESFRGTGLTGIDLSNVTEVGNYAFSECKALAGVKFSPEIKKLGIQSFSFCSGLTAVSLPEGLVELGKECFEHCTSLGRIDLPESLTVIGARCLQGCESLTSVRIPPNVRKLDSHMFFGDSNLSVIELPIACKIPGGQDPFMMCQARLVFY